MLKKLFIGLLVLLLLVVITAAATLLITAPEQPAPDSNSAAWLQAGPYSVASAEFVFMDGSRPTAPNGEFPGAPQRTFETTLWFPEEAVGSVPLIIHSHGVVSSRSDLGYVARHLASYGYVVAAANHPLSHGAAPGGPNPRDVVNQPADMSFLIDSVLSLTGDDKPFNATVDPDRIGLMGYSLGGLTATMATFHPRLRDTRVRAAVSIAGPAALFTERFYETTETPFLMIAGADDALINHQAHAAPIPERVSSGDLVTILGGTHLGFAALSEPLMRFMDQPDSLGCSAVLATLGGDSSNAIYLGLGTESEGVVVSDSIPEVCEVMPTGNKAQPGRQQMITTIAVLSFFESIFADQPEGRLEARTQLAAYLSQDFPEAVFRD